MVASRAGVRGRNLALYIEQRMEPPFPILGEAPVPLLIIGGVALQAHHYTRQTIDCDCIIAAANLSRLAAHLAENDYREEGRIGHFVTFWHARREQPPLDVMLVDEVTFGKLLVRSVPYEFGAVTLRVPALLHLIALKLHAMKNAPERAHKDFADIVELLECNQRAVSARELEEVCDRFGPPDIFEKLEALVDDEP